MPDRRYIWGIGDTEDNGPTTWTVPSALSPAIRRYGLPASSLPSRVDPRLHTCAPLLSQCIEPNHPNAILHRIPQTAARSTGHVATLLTVQYHSHLSSELPKLLHRNPHLLYSSKPILLFEKCYISREFSDFVLIIVFLVQMFAHGTGRDTLISHSYFSTLSSFVEKKVALPENLATPCSLSFLLPMFVLSSGRVTRC